MPSSASRARLLGMARPYRLRVTPDESTGRAHSRISYADQMVATRAASRADARPVPASLAPGIPAQARLHVVTGKGGTGKTTVAAAIALALAEGGRKVLLVEVESRQSIAQLFNIPPMPYTEQRLAKVGRGGELYALAIDP